MLCAVYVLCASCLVLQHYEETLSRVLASSDELMHILTYDWLIKTGQSAQLLQVTSPYLDTYLTQAAEKEVRTACVICLLYCPGQPFSAVHVTLDCACICILLVQSCIFSSLAWTSSFPLKGVKLCWNLEVEN